ncbi:TIGR02996 domain-containing protein [Tuwongella immobilis]|uniref:Uncharacterized protein n=1 Tax=Tuwongella immobilis TaxID=692036 RepID=A0A6C2YIN5_9BACT|nr:TIGR02996 domain-containing protein [Tuwongella immobilis]VIP01408.1 unnamed protein product [Tuwongella immobilis]VTR98316.1 unnamed protein product [Tuwongella immobilis]
MIPQLPQPLLEAIWYAGDDPTPRLLAADWLEEQGETDWALLVRIQLDRFPSAGIPIHEIRTQLANRLLEPLGPLLPYVRRGLLFRSGFPSILEIRGTPDAELLAHLRHLPTLQELTIVSPDGLAPSAIEAILPLRGLTRLQLPLRCQELTPAQVVQLGSFPQLRIADVHTRFGFNLLTAQMDRFHAAKRQAITELPPIARTQAIQAMLGSHHVCLSPTESRYDSQSWHSDGLFARLDPHLRHLSIHRLSPDGLEHLAACSQLESLRLIRCRATDFGSWPQLPHLRELSLTTDNLPIPARDLARWLQSHPQLEMFAFRAPIDDANQFWQELSFHPGLRVLHGAWEKAPAPQLNAVRLPELIELAMPIQESYRNTDPHVGLPKLRIWYDSNSDDFESGIWRRELAAIGVWASDLSEPNEMEQLRRFFETFCTWQEWIDPHGGRWRFPVPPDWIIASDQERATRTNGPRLVASVREFGPFRDAIEGCSYAPARIHWEWIEPPELANSATPAEATTEMDEPLPATGPGSLRSWLQWPLRLNSFSHEVPGLGDDAANYRDDDRLGLQVVWQCGSGILRLSGVGSCLRVVNWTDYFTTLAQMVQRPQKG